VNRVAELQRVVRGFRPGQTIDIEAMRFGEKKSFKVKLTEPPAQEETVASNDRDPVDPVRRESKSYERLGITVQPVSEEIAAAANLRDEYKRGLMVTNVSVRGPAYRELQAGDIILQALKPKRDIRSAADLETIVKGVKGGEILTLVVYSRGSTGVVNLAIDK
jgi:serine protease Do